MSGMTRNRPVLALVTATLLAAVACGSDGESDDNDPAPREPAESAATGDTDEDTVALEERVRAYTDAYFAPDADTAYGMLSQRCQDQIDTDVYAAQLDQAAADFGQLTVETLNVDDLSGDMARVTYSVGLPMLDEQLVEQPWVRDGGQWLYDAC
jgi:hypothetical protein